MADVPSKKQKLNKHPHPKDSSCKQRQSFSLGDLKTSTIGDFCNFPSTCNQKLLEQAFECQRPGFFTRTFVINQRVCPMPGILLCVVNRKTATVEFSRVFQSVAIIHSFTSTSKTLMSRSKESENGLALPSVSSSLSSIGGKIRFSVKKRCPLQDRMVFNTNFDRQTDCQKDIRR